MWVRNRSRIIIFKLFHNLSPFQFQTIRVSCEQVEPALAGFRAGLELKYFRGLQDYSRRAIWLALTFL